MSWLNKHSKAIRIVAIVVFTALVAAHIAIHQAGGLANDSLDAITITILYIFAFLATYAIKAYIMLPPVPVLYIAAGATFPTAWAIVITLLGLAINMTIGYHNGKKIGAKKAAELLAKNKKAARFMESRKPNLALICFAARATPLPKDLFSMFFGAVKMPFPQFLAISLLGISPIMTSIVLAGSAVLNPLSLGFLVPLGSSFLIATIIFIVSKNKQHS